MTTSRYFVWRSAVTGKFVSRAYAEANPETTIRQIVTVKRKEG